MIAAPMTTNFGCDSAVISPVCHTPHPLGWGVTGAVKTQPLLGLLLRLNSRLRARGSFILATTLSIWRVTRRGLVAKGHFYRSTLMHWRKRIRQVSRQMSHKTQYPYQRGRGVDGRGTPAAPTSNTHGPILDLTGTTIAGENYDD